MKEYKMKLRVMADVHSSGIWEIAPVSSRERHTMIDYEELGLPQELVDTFSDWIESYWLFLGNDYYVEFEAETDPPTRGGEEIP